MIDHTGLMISDPAVSRKFYDNALAPLGYQMMVQIPKEHTGGAAVFGYGVPPKPDFWVSEGAPNEPRVHVRHGVSHVESGKCSSIALPGAHSLE
jgi:catechol 2,3-dioxygenase-like lactoylglutathione lyase family enzyme